MIGDSVLPSNTERGYFVRRLVRRAVRHADIIEMKEGALALLVEPLIAAYEGSYLELEDQKEEIKKNIQEEEERFRLTLKKGLKEFEKISSRNITGKEAFDLYQTYGFPLDITLELAKEKGVLVDTINFQEEFVAHQEISRTAAAGRFKGGLADASYATTKLHTANHLLLAALREVLGDHVHQRGSNITQERIRLDFSQPQKVTPEQLQEVENLVNVKIQENLEMVKEEMTKEEAVKLGAEMEFGIKYGDTVSVYVLKDAKGNAFSKEFCGGPHVQNTSELSQFEIIKEEAVSTGVRRIRAVLKAE
jgi:alanyl-tRNA synthetase